MEQLRYDMTSLGSPGVRDGHLQHCRPTDSLYPYDGLNRLSDFDRGDLNANKDGIATLSFAQEWSLKALGNWDNFKEDANGNGTFSDSSDLDQTRTHNAANEITDISETAGQTAWATPQQDAMGNITSYPKPSAPASSYTCTYDAWNRLTEVRDGGTLIAGYGYDGLGRRIGKKTYSGGQLNQLRQFFYSNSWQVLEERELLLAHNVERQYVWGVMYVDELIERDRDSNDDGTLEERLYALQDANYSLTCLIDTNGDAQERYLYTPYGTRTILDGSFGARSSSSYDWNVGHPGLMHDVESGMVAHP